MTWRVTTLALLLSAVGFGQDLKQAENLYQHTEYEAALRLLRAQPSSPQAFLLMGKCAMMLGDFRKATDAFEKSSAADPNNSEYLLWLGRSWARRAETASPFTAPMNASKARGYFERAVALNTDPRNHDAMDDLFDYYVNAPGFLGGGFDKAEALAERIEKVDPAQGHSDRAEIARRRKEIGRAEQELRRAVQLAPHEAGHVVELALLLARQGRIQESDAVLEQAARTAPGNPRLLYGRARVYIETHRNLGQARMLLEQYMRSNLTPDDPSREDAKKLLKQAGIS